tara:strand:+ start:683 stop:919 length:237 start_codon:yes stop_codon:yes gene_type:complete
MDSNHGNEYKEFVEALGGKKNSGIDLTGAQFVLLKFDRIFNSWDEEFERPDVIVSYDNQRIVLTVFEDNRGSHLFIPP